MLSFLPATSDLGASELFYLFVVGMAVLGSFALLPRPFVNLGVTIAFLASANTAILGTAFSAGIAALLILNTLIGTVLVSGLKVPVERHALWIALLLCGIASLGAVHGFAQGNRALLVLGDFYQIVELALLFVLAQALVKTEGQFRTTVNILIASILATCVLQMADVLTDASYLADSHLEREGGPDLIRTINMNAPIAFVVILAALAVTQTKWELFAGLAVVEINLILGFTRGLWLAAVASGIVLLMVMRFSRGAVLKLGFVAAVFATVFLYVFGLDDVAAKRVGFGVEQMRSLPNERQVVGTVPRTQQLPGEPSATDELAPNASPRENPILAGRRRLEYLLILPQVARSPVMGAGLGATYQIYGDAIFKGEKGKVVENHYIHDLYLQVAYRLGIPALLILLALLGAYFRRSLKNLRELDLSPENTAVMAGLIAAMFAEVLLSLTSPTLLNHPTAGVTGFVMAITTAALRRSTQPTIRPGIKPG